MAPDSAAPQRTWLVASLPHPLPAGTPVAQGYVVSDEEVAVRVRRDGPRHAVAVEGRGARHGVDLEWEATAEQFEALWSLARCRRLHKVRHEVDLGSVTAAVDVFGGPLEGLVLVEVDFQDDDAAAGFDAPDWFGDEVTGDARCQGPALARSGLPERLLLGRAGRS